MGENKINVKLLRRVKRLILEEPRRFNMASFVNKSSTQRPPCGTVACIAGWAIIEHDRSKKVSGSVAVTDEYVGRVGSFQETGAEVLGLTDEQAERLFFTADWPRELSAAYHNAPRGSLERAQIAADRIEHFIKTNGAE